MKIILLASLTLLTGCAMTFQPFQPVGREEFRQAQENILALAQAVTKLDAEMKEVKK